MDYIAVIGDIKDSRLLNNRGEIQKQLIEAFNHINIEYKKEIASKFTITLGDEFEGLLCSTEHLLEIIKCIQMAMFPVGFHFGIGIGKIYTRIYFERVNEIDGPAFYAARNAINDIRQKKDSPFVLDIQVSVYGDNSFRIKQINTLLALITSIEVKWTTTTRMIIWDMYLNRGTIGTFAAKQNMSALLIERLLKSGDYHLYRKAMEVTSESINQLLVSD